MQARHERVVVNRSLTGYTLLSVLLVLTLDVPWLSFLPYSSAEKKSLHCEGII